MRKKIIGGLAIVAIAAIGTLNIGLSNNNEDLSVVSLANIEALASGESGKGKYGVVDCDGHKIVCTGHGDLICCK